MTNIPQQKNPLDLDNLKKIENKDDYTLRLEEYIENLTQKVTHLEKLQEEKDNFFTSISHEIRTPMNAVIGLSSVLLNTDIENSYKKQIERIEMSGQHILGLINDILDFSKIEANKLSIERKEFRLGEMLEKIASIVSLKAYEKHIDLVFDIDQDVPTYIVGDSLRLSQVLINILNNAIKFTKRGSVTLYVEMLEVKNNSTYLKFKVSDTGIGIKKEAIETLFDAYTQADTSTARQFGGTGLGLLISKKLVELMDGEIEVESEVGKGSDFIFTIKIDSWKKHSSDLLESTLLNKNVLILDSDKKSTKALTKILDCLSYQVHELEENSDIVSFITTHKIEIVYLDQSYIEKYKNAFMGLRGIKTILLHKNTEVIENYQIFDMEIHEDLAKPFTRQMVFDVISKAYNIKTKNIIKQKANKQDLKALKGTHILLAEDNNINQSLIRALLDDTGIKLSIASNGKEIFPILEKNDDIDLIFMDTQMPLMDGYEAMEALNKINNKVPVISFSADASVEAKERSLSSGMIDVLVKPIDAKSFYDIILTYVKPTQDFTSILNEILVEFNTFIGTGNMKGMLKLSRSLKEHENIKMLPEVLSALSSLENSVLNYQKVFFVLLGHYEKAYLKVDNSIKSFEANGTLTEDEKKNINFSQNHDKYNSQEEYIGILKEFLDKYKDSKILFETKIKEWKFDETVQLALRIKEDAQNIDVAVISNTIAPVSGISQTQIKIIERKLNLLTKIVKSEN